MSHPKRSLFERCVDFIHRITARKPPYYTIDQMIEMTDEPNRSGWKRLFAENMDLFTTVWGSTNNHQAWPGGIHDHFEDMGNKAILIYRAMASTGRPMPGTLSDLLNSCFGHDIEKPWKYIIDEHGVRHHRPGMETKENHNDFRMKKLEEYGIVVSPMIANGIKYAEGELTDYSNRERKMLPLAAFTHAADVLSARWGFDFPAESNDPWTGAQRINSIL